MKYRILTGIFLIFLQTSIVFAHGDEPRIELKLTQASPGATIDVRGTGFGPLEIITFVLVDSSRVIPISAIEADIHGDFTVGLLLPPDLIHGEYELRASDSHHAASVALSIVPDADPQEDGERREAEDALLAPMPALPTADPGSVHASAQPDSKPASTAAGIVMGTALLLIALGALLVVQRRLIKRS